MSIASNGSRRALVVAAAISTAFGVAEASAAEINGLVQMPALKPNSEMTSTFFHVVEATFVAGATSVIFFMFHPS